MAHSNLHINFEKGFPNHHTDMVGCEANIRLYIYTFPRHAEDFICFANFCRPGWCMLNFHQQDENNMLAAEDYTIRIMIFSLCTEFGRWVQTYCQCYLFPALCLSGDSINFVDACSFILPHKFFTSPRRWGQTSCKLRKTLGHTLGSFTVVTSVKDFLL